MKKLVIAAILNLACVNTFSQLISGTWLVGGVGKFSRSANTFESNDTTSLDILADISISCDIGYFIIDRLSVGLRTSYSKYKATIQGVSNDGTNDNRLEFGPFVKYYFLNTDRQFNIVADVSYQYGRFWHKPQKGPINKFSISAGTVVFFNSSVGLEMLIGYFKRKEEISYQLTTTHKQQGLQIGIGFHFS